MGLLTGSRRMLAVYRQDRKPPSRRLVRRIGHALLAHGPVDRRAHRAVLRSPQLWLRFRCSVLFILSSIAIGVVLPPGLIAQEPGDTVLGRLERGTLLRVRTDDDRRIEASLSAVTRDSILMRSRESDVAVALGEIDSLWTGSRSSARGATVGALVGGTASLGFLAYGCALAAEGGGCEPTVLMLGSLTGAAAGGLLGSVLGGSSVRWELRYTREARLEIGLVFRPEYVPH